MADPGVPDWPLSWRLRRALEYAGVSVGEMARELGVNRATISRWTHGSGRPRAAYLKVWALRCGVRYEWLFDGTVSADPSGQASGGVRLPYKSRAMLHGSPLAAGGSARRPAGRGPTGRPAGRAGTRGRAWRPGSWPDSSTGL